MAIGVDELERVMADGWPAVESDRLGEWMLRASSGFTQRGNSVLAVGESGLAPGAAIGVVETWYAARGLPALFCLATDVAGEPVATELVQELGTRGYTSRRPTLTLTAESRQLPALTETSPPVTVDAQLRLDWLQAFAAYRPIVPGVAEQILTGSRGQVFLSVPRAEPSEPSDSAPAGRTPALRAIARMSAYPEWAGIHAMWVAPEHRRQGLATAMVAAVARLGGLHELPRVYLQVERANPAALAAYEGMGFVRHHGHAYLAR